MGYFKTKSRPKKAPCSGEELKFCIVVPYVYSVNERTGKFHTKNISDPGLAQGLYAKY
jgi:hypothetical protein